MGSSTNQKSQQTKERQTIQVPEWAMPIFRVCNAIYPFFLAVGGLALLLVLALIFVKRPDLPWIPNVIGAVGLFTAIGLLALLIAEYGSLIIPWVTLVVGLVLYYMPFLLGLLLGKFDLPMHDRVTELSATCKNLGVYTVFLSVIALMLAFIRMWMQREEDRRNIRYQYSNQPAKDTEKPGMVPKCWQMSRCRPSVRSTCPNYVDHVTCWKRRSGCFCDHDLANYLMTSTGRNESQEVIDMQKDAGALKAAGALRAKFADRKRRRPWKEQKRLCLSCPLFIEHQEYKYRHYSWLSFPITGALVAAAYPYFDMGYKWAAGRLDDFMQRFADVPVLTTGTSLVDSSFEYILMSVLTILLLSYVISFLDKFFLEWKL